ncbi:hypothetical protein K474DRAFT_1603338 [Panus rudis PR-1116 ss-1]|nr:hypothetical protein K474DRAFT_1603338 [Panus rudis PR-1116 ss-1]
MRAEVFLSAVLYVLASTLLSFSFASAKRDISLSHLPRRHSRLSASAKRSNADAAESSAERHESDTSRVGSNLNATWAQKIETRQFSSQNIVVAHHVVGFTANYGIGDWANDIALAQSKGIDAFALNFGPDNWEAVQISNAYIASITTTSSQFKLFLSFDMSSFPCQNPGDAAIIRQFINGYNGHPAQLVVDGRMVVSTFSGEGCMFGTGNVNQGWENTVKSGLPATYFIPAFFMNPDQFGNYPVADGMFNWNAAWPQGDFDIDFSVDQQWLNNLGGRGYMAGVSPWFFTHYSPQSFNKNWIYRSDDWLFAARWEEVIQNRGSVRFVQVETWNDYSESHYVGPIEGVQPGSQAWVDGFDHLGWLDLMKYYITAFKTGSYPPITKDRIFLWGRLYPAAANAPDPVAKPNNWQWTDDFLWAVVLLPSPGSVTLTCGPNSQTFSVSAGLSKLKLPFTTSCSVSSQIVRNGVTTVSFNPPGFNFNTNPPSYNFNAFVAASPA